MSFQITPEIVKEFFHYDPAVGVLRWRPRDRKWFTSDRQYKNWNTRYANNEAGYTHKKPDGALYKKVSIFKREYAVHRVIFMWMEGRWPDPQIDHKDGDGLNNVWNNLREATASQNNYNRRAKKSNKSGYKGVHPVKNGFKATISVEGKSMSLGTFSTAKDAYMAYKRAAERYHGEFADFGEDILPKNALSAIKNHLKR